MFQISVCFQSVETEHRRWSIQCLSIPYSSGSVAQVYLLSDGHLPLLQLLEVGGAEIVFLELIGFDSALILSLILNVENDIVRRDIQRFPHFERKQGRLRPLVVLQSILSTQSETVLLHRL